MPDGARDPGLSLPSMRQLIDGATAVLAEAGVASPRHDALELAAAALGLAPTARLELALAPPVTTELIAAMTQLVERRRRREPLQQILGYAVFRYVTLRMAPGVFVPRPETEVVAGAAIEEVARLVRAGEPRPLVVDLCSGSGAIAASVAHETPARVVAVDAAPEAARLTRANLDAVREEPSRVEVGDVRDPGLFQVLAGEVAVLVANPPYIPPDAVPNDVEVRDHDPDLALYGGGLDGLTLPAAVVEAAVRLLRPGGLLVMEHADTQGEGTRSLAERTGAFVEIATERDLTGRDRYLRARRV
ncbi:N5-glutamine methyltransferase family protein [Pseudactinotalea suaedae]|uniref:N5-glutamine methyltransferase family protein n=1 Tax=Pseudactinotalea suaedae TaxID=1524924 RepID=UPI001F4F66BF|nr:HemK/PrmC family methyltransferase [Pseudactinotalea suaedae]